MRRNDTGVHSGKCRVASNFRNILVNFCKSRFSLETGVAGKAIGRRLAALDALRMKLWTEIMRTVLPFVLPTPLAESLGCLSARNALRYVTGRLSKA